jgi:hypothetical protein
MTDAQLLAPVLVQVLLTFIVLILMGGARGRSLTASKRTLDDPAVANGTVQWSEDALLRSNNFKNQFEIPVLFYAAVLFALYFKQSDGVMIGLAWIFAVSRVLHAGVHLGSNVVMWRGAFYLIGVAALAAMWVVLGTSVMMGGV